MTDNKPNRFICIICACVVRHFFDKVWVLAVERGVDSVELMEILRDSITDKQLKYQIRKWSKIVVEQNPKLLKTNDR